MSPTGSERFGFAREICLQGGKQTLTRFQSAAIEVERKGDHSPVTQADRDCELLLRDLISKRFPDDGIVGEEFGEQKGSSGYRWILDPIDGTKSFISGVPLYGTMVAVEKDGQALIGAVSIPGLNECIFAEVGQGCWHQVGDSEPTKANVSNCDQLKEAKLVVSEVKTFNERSKPSIYSQLQDSVFIVRTWGDCYGYMLVATGRVDLMIDPILNIWDAAAVQPIINEAGGRFTDWQGQDRIDTGDAIGSNGKLHEQVLEMTRQG